MINVSGCFCVQNGHVGFMLSCYDAQMSYDPRTDTFQARYAYSFVLFCFVLCYSD